MPSCTHPIARLHVQMRRDPQTAAPEYHLICDTCGKDIPLALQDSFLWLKLLELRDMLAGMVIVQQNPLKRDPMGGS